MPVPMRVLYRYTLQQRSTRGERYPGASRGGPDVLMLGKGGRRRYLFSLCLGLGVFLLEPSVGTGAVHVVQIASDSGADLVLE